MYILFSSFLLLNSRRTKATFEIVDSCSSSLPPYPYQWYQRSSFSKYDKPEGRVVLLRTRAVVLTPQRFAKEFLGERWRGISQVTVPYFGVSRFRISFLTPDHHPLLVFDVIPPRIYIAPGAFGRHGLRGRPKRHEGEDNGRRGETRYVCEGGLRRKGKGYLGLKCKRLSRGSARDFSIGDDDANDDDADDDDSPSLFPRTEG